MEVPLLGIFDLSFHLTVNNCKNINFNDNYECIVDFSQNLYTYKNTHMTHTYIHTKIFFPLGFQKLIRNNMIS